MIFWSLVPNNFVNKTWHHCHSWLAGQYLFVFAFRPPFTSDIDATHVLIEPHRVQMTQVWRFRQDYKTPWWVWGWDRKICPEDHHLVSRGLAITLMYCNRLHAWWSTQSGLATLLSSLIARRWVGLQTLWWFRLNDLSIDEMVGAWCFGCLSGPPGCTCWISFAPVFSFIYCWVLIFALSPGYILIYMF